MPPRRRPHGSSAPPRLEPLERTSAKPSSRFRLLTARVDELEAELAVVQQQTLEVQEATARTRQQELSAVEGTMVYEKAMGSAVGELLGLDDERSHMLELRASAEEAVQQAAASKGGLQVKGLKKMNSGERKRVPRGCSYSVEAEMAIYNKNPNGTSTHGRMYQLACIALSHETLKAAHEEQADSNKAHKASKASKEAAHRANKASRHSAKGARVGGAPEVGGETQSDPTGEGGVVEYDIPGEYDPHDEEGGPCPTDPVPPCPPDHGGPGQEPCPHSSHPDVGCHMPGNAPQCNEVHKAHPDHDPALPDCDTMAGSGDPWAASPPPSARTLGLSE